MIKRQLFALYGALLFAVSLAPLCMAQNQPAAPPRTQVTIVRVKPEMAAEYREYLKNEVLPAYQKAGAKERSVWARATFGEAFEYAFGSPIESMAQFDNPSPLVKALGQESLTALIAKRNRMIVSAQNLVVQARPELNIIPKTPTQPKLAFAARITVAPGRTAEYESYLKNDVLPLLQKAGAKFFLVSRVQQGGDTNEYLTLNMFDTFAEQDKWAQALSKLEGYSKLAAKTVGIVLHRETVVWRYVPELSLPQAPANSASK